MFFRKRRSGHGLGKIGWQTGQPCVDGIFGERIRFLGIQGSYGRGEATAESDIDVVLLLDGLQLEDLQAYDEAVSALPMREKLCGFVGGWEELIHWDKADLFQFIQDTITFAGQSGCSLA